MGSTGPKATRRQLILGAAAGAVAAPLLGSGRQPVAAMAFDAFVLFNPMAIRQLAQSLAGPNSAAFIAAASSRLFAYTWFYTSAGRYRSFEELAASAFRFAAESNGIALSDADIRDLADAYSSLELWPDVVEGIDQLRRRGVRLAVLSNMSEQALAKNLARGGIDRAFEHVLSTDRVQRYKPAPEAYRLAVSAFYLKPAQIGFAASAGWDAAGATWFGFPSAWINRTDALAEQANIAPQIVSKGMEGVLRLAESPNRP
jgi:2-haloacid dehalogenase